MDQKIIDFDFDGTMRDCEIKNGKYVSVDIYSVINKNGTQ